MIGFCGEFSPPEDDLECPGRFYNSWGFEDRGRLYVEGQWDSIPSQRGVNSSFEQGDTITVDWKSPTTTTSDTTTTAPTAVGVTAAATTATATATTTTTAAAATTAVVALKEIPCFYSKKSKSSKTGVEFRSELTHTGTTSSSVAAPLLSHERFSKGKIYPCIGLDASFTGVGLEIEVVFGNSGVGVGSKPAKGV